jgi:AbrB family transcriptional regulator (stage V sporulation protein T)
MNPTGIIRKIDDLGRIVLPKELRRHLNINTGDDFQIILDNNRILLERYSYLKNYEKDILKIIESFTEVTNYDINLVINNEIVNKNNSKILENIINIISERKLYVKEEVQNYKISNDVIKEGKIVIFPIVINSDLLGSIIIISKDNTNNLINTAKIINNLIKNYYI